MKFDKFTIKVQEVLMAAQSLSQNNENQQIEPLHLLISLIEQKDGITTPLFQKLGVNLYILLSDLKAELDKLPKVTGPGVIDVRISPRTKKIFDVAWKEAGFLRDQYLSTEHLLIAIAADESLSIYPILVN
ncbi:MAG: Clp protease N-terminal domain-containing protein, partial [Promethearchaeota archaeon]